MTKFGRGCMTALLLVGLVGVAYAAEPNPRGRPEGMEAGLTQRWYVWHDNDGWHVRTTTKNVQRDFRGTIRVIGGKINSVNAAKLEKKGSNPDWWKLSENNTVLTLDLKTNQGMDGFDFDVGSRADQIDFDLKIDGKSNPEHIFIGRKAAHPSSAHFILPAHPGK